ncbi:protein kinase domain-containing protein [Candidatus Proelusimicrobium volucris]|uniref:protein kinase domain-containing protein n=1 Tax=Candidatus Proelusimicrobium volucris TaxID=3416225 RepID=UPI003D148AC3
MTKLLMAVLFAFIPLFGFAAQAAPIIVEGRYSAGFKNIEDGSNIKKAAALENALNEIERKLETGDYTTVLNACQSLLDNNYDDPRIYTLMARAYEESKDFDNAYYFASQAIAKSPSNVEAYTTRAHSYLERKDIMRATEDIDTALKLNPRSSRAKSVQDLINEAQKPAKKKRASLSDYRLPPWFFVYFVCVVLVIAFYVVLRYYNVFGGPVDVKGRKLKEVNIKEQYHFIRPIGEGGMGKVYEAYDNALKRKVAVKRIKPELLRNDYVREQFLSEARMVAMLHHPCIVEIYTVIETVNSLYLVFEYVDGQTLETRLDIDSYIDFDEVKNIFESVCQGLSYAHSQNIVHCDLKPGNIMIADSGVAKVMDFGVAQKITDDNEDKSHPVAGTPAYMSPEQQKGITSKQSDIYSLAVCLYEALVGQVPWSVKGFDVTTKKIVPPSQIAPYVPKEIDELIFRSLNEDPSKRIQTVEQFWNILKNSQAVNS